MKTGKYAYLIQFLKEIPSEQEEITLPFAEVAKLTDGLPPSAYKHNTWWTSNLRVAVLGSGWRVLRGDLVGHTAIFRRDSSGSRIPRTGKTISRVTTHAGKYAYVIRLLTDIPPDMEEITLTFEDVSELTGGLPASAYIHNTWWTSNLRKAIRGSGWRVSKGDLAGQKAMFRRENSEVGKSRAGKAVPGVTAPSGGQRGSSVRFAEFLETLPSAQNQIALTFAEVAELRGALPQSAFQYPSWWGNRDSPPYWPSENWRVQDVHMNARIAVFRRKGSDTQAAIERYVRHLLAGDCPLEALAPARLLEWLRLCRQIGRPFEATILYERTLHDREQFSEKDADEAERIYTACRRISSAPRSQRPAL